MGPLTAFRISRQVGRCCSSAANRHQPVRLGLRNQGYEWSRQRHHVAGMPAATAGNAGHVDNVSTNATKAIARPGKRRPGEESITRRALSR